MILAAAIALTGSAFGQGQVTMGNNAGSLIIDNFGTAVTSGSTSFQLLAGATADSLQAIGTIAGVGFPGRIANTVVNIAGVAPGQTAFFQIQAWQSSFASYAAAVAGNGGTGLSQVFSAATSSAGPPPGTPTALAGLFPGFAVIVPEPSTIALGLIGAGSLLFLRRKK